MYACTNALNRIIGEKQESYVTRADMHVRQAPKAFYSLYETVDVVQKHDFFKTLRSFCLLAS